MRVFVQVQAWAKCASAERRVVDRRAALQRLAPGAGMESGGLLLRSSSSSKARACALSMRSAFMHERLLLCMLSTPPWQVHMLCTSTPAARTSAVCNQDDDTRG